MKTSKIKIFFMAAVFSLLPSTGAFAADVAGGILNGEIGATGWDASVNGSKAKFSEYRDMTGKQGVFGDIRLNYDHSNYWGKFTATDIGYGTQRYQFDAGLYGKVKVDAFYNEIIHNITFGALTPYIGAGGNTLTYTGSAPSRSPSTWNGFDYYIQRKQTGGGFNLDLLKPFYVDFSAMNEKRTGTLPVGGGTGETSPGALIELPAPVDYTTNNFNGEIGYATRPLTASIDFIYSDFGNANHVLDYESILSTKTDSTTLPTNNDYYRVGFKGSALLPLNSRLNVNLANARSESEFDLLQSYLLTGTAVQSLVTSPNSLSATTFHGKKDIQNYNIVVTSNPVSYLDGKIFYKYYSTTNNSDQITTVDTMSTNTLNPTTTITNNLFDYRRNTIGADLGIKLPDKFHFDVGYSYVKTDRSREDIPMDFDNIVKAELRWNGSDFVTPKISYEHLQRSAAGPTAADLASTNNFGIDSWLRRFDASSQTRDTYKVAADFYPVENLDLGLALQYIKANWAQDILGTRSKTTAEADFTGQYPIGQIASVSAYFDLQNIKTYSYFRRFDSTHNDVNPFDPQTSSNYNWDMSINDNTYEFGAAAEVYLMPKKLTLRLQYDYTNSDGSDDLNILNTAALAAISTTANNGNIDIPNFDDYRDSSFTAKLSYLVTRSLSVAAGFSYEEYKYNDVAVDNYQYFFSNSTGTTPYYLSGAYSSPSYTARVFFLAAAYRF